MPRTKITKTLENAENIKPDKRKTGKIVGGFENNIKPDMKKLNDKMTKEFMQALQAKDSRFDAAMEDMVSTMSFQLKTGLNEIVVSIPFNQAKNLHELKLEAEKPPSETIISKSILGNLTRSTVKNSTLMGSIRKGNTSRPVRRSRSQTSVARPKINRLSKSLTRKPVNNELVTPANKQGPSSFGMVTPKMKPNTPQVFLRWPKQGEVAISMQGSPLMVASVMSDHVNLNIPLQDGRILSMQPNQGLRPSEVPTLDSETLRQIETLRDNLNKVCAFSSKR